MKENTQPVKTKCFKNIKPTSTSTPSSLYVFFVKLYVTPAPTEPCGRLQNLEPETKIIQPIPLSRLSQNQMIFRKKKSREIDNLNKRQWSRILEQRKGGHA